MVIKKANFLCGIRHWVQWYTLRTPKFEVFRFIGADQNQGIFYFQSVKEKTIIGRSFYQLNANGFVPFCLDFKRSQEYLQSKGDGPHAFV